MNAPGGAYLTSPTAVNKRFLAKRFSTASMIRTFVAFCLFSESYLAFVGVFGKKQYSIIAFLLTLIFVINAAFANKCDDGMDYTVHAWYELLILSSKRVIPAR